jgi:hypothetical protein
VAKVITLSGLTQVDELPKGSECTPVEDATLTGTKVIRCKEDVVELEKSAPAKLGEVVALKRPRKRGPGHRLGSVDKPCVPEWIVLRTKGGKSLRRCHCKNGRLTKSSLCER